MLKIITQMLPFRICTADFPQSIPHGWHSVQTSLHFPVNRKLLSSWKTTNAPKACRKWILLDSYCQAGMHHSIFSRQAVVHWTSQWALQFLAHNAENHADISFLHLPEGREHVRLKDQIPLWKFSYIRQPWVGISGKTINSEMLQAFNQR